MVDNGGPVAAPQGGDTSATPDVPSDQPPSPRPLAPRRNTAMWAVCVAVVCVAVITVLAGARLGAFGLAGILVGAAVARLVVPGPGFVGIVVRSRSIDATMYFTLAAAIAVLAQTAPDI